MAIFGTTSVEPNSPKEPPGAAAAEYGDVMLLWTVCGWPGNGMASRKNYYCTSQWHNDVNKD